jgi:hypothetical protein
MTWKAYLHYSTVLLGLYSKIGRKVKGRQCVADVPGALLDGCVKVVLGVLYWDAVVHMDPLGNAMPCQSHEAQVDVMEPIKVENSHGVTCGRNNTFRH